MDFYIRQYIVIGDEKGNKKYFTVLSVPKYSFTSPLMDCISRLLDSMATRDIDKLSTFQR